jgi:hypothetical protein
LILGLHHSETELIEQPDLRLRGGAHGYMLDDTPRYANPVERRGSSLRRDNLIRMLALIALSALVYYFSFSQGRDSVEPRLRLMEEALMAKERVIEKMAAEIKHLKNEQESSSARPGTGELEFGAEDETPNSINIRLHASRILFNENLVITCLDIDRTESKARIQINLVREEKLLTQTISLGQGLRFDLGNTMYILILERLQASHVTVQLVRV